MAAAAAPSESLSFRKVLSESGRIIRSHNRNFQVLTALFVFPLSVCSILYRPIIQTKLLPHQLSELDYSNILAHLNPYQYALLNLLLNFLLNLLYSLFVNIFSFCSIAIISYITYHGFHDEPVDLIESIKSILYSFWPLFSTFLVLILIVVLMAIPLSLLALFVYKWIDSTSYNLIIHSVILIALVFVVVMIYIQVNFILFPAVSVIESKRGYAALKRSAYLVKGNRRVVLKMLLYFGLVYGLIFPCLNGSYPNGWWFLLYIICGSISLSYFLLLSYVAIPVLYVYCRDSHEGLLPIFQDAKKLPLIK